MSEDAPLPIEDSLPIEEPPPAPPVHSWPLPPPLPLPLPPRPPGVWPALVVGIGVIPVAIVASAVTLIVYLVLTGGATGLRGAQDSEALVARMMSTPGGFFVLILPGQLTFLFVALGAAMFSPQPIRQRLGMLRPRLPFWSLPLLVLATPLFGIAGSMLMQALIKEPSAQLKMLSNMANGPTGAFAVVVALMVSLMPPLTEETMFRGFIQRQLLDRWGPLAAISVSSLLFTVAHFDPAHMLGVLPEYRNTGVGRTLKLTQRDDAIARGIDLIEWTFDPLEIKNAFFNMERLGAIVRRYVPNQYGTTSSPLHGGLPTDRCIAEWWISSPRVTTILDGGYFTHPPAEARVSIPSDIATIRANDPASAREIQQKASEQFSAAFNRGLAVIGFEKSEEAGTYLLGKWESA